MRSMRQCSACLLDQSVDLCRRRSVATRNRSSANPRTSALAVPCSAQNVRRTCSASCFPISDWNSICSASSRDLRRVPIEERSAFSASVCSLRMCSCRPRIHLLHQSCWQEPASQRLSHRVYLTAVSLLQDKNYLELLLRRFLPCSELRGARTRNLLLLPDPSRSEVALLLPRADGRELIASFNDAISTAASAASNPLFPIFSPARSIACSRRVASQHTKSMRHPSLLRRLPDAPRDFVDDDVVVRRISAQQTSDADDGVVFPGRGQSPRRRRNLKCSRHADNVDVVLRSPASQQPIASTQQQAAP